MTLQNEIEKLNKEIFWSQPDVDGDALIVFQKYQTPELITLIQDREKQLNHDHEILVNTILDTKNKEIQDREKEAYKKAYKDAGVMVELLEGIDSLEGAKPNSTDERSKE